ncbi:recombinase family protein [Candidatus Erwinia haradaeae]|uniref:Resolvase, Tn3 family protein n=1 Tax=Candidatus Erwinia haradaeae TaxID=1922217 RepID=A0A7U3JXY6_9GAMM|nr:recombinase family protein [Candidatus Erwinia haradaeae]VFP88926.1 Resolvase, Tn3 family protein [Candidatus Erwinia haradaeae]VFP88933.1 Resolvase, Tn3 family protein [Candidatus Erwinia haradaeae]
MIGQRIGYTRISTIHQNPQRQLDGIKVDRMFTDVASGKEIKRPQLAALIDFVRSGDTVLIHSMDRLARNLNDLRRIIQMLTQRGVRIEFVQENLSFTGEDSPLSNLMLAIIGAFSEFERSLLKERQREGIELAKQRGVYRGRKRALSEKQITELCQRVAAGEKKVKIARDFSISRETLYQYIRRAG